MALKRMEVDLNKTSADVTEDDGSDASTSDLAIVYNDAAIGEGDKNTFLDHLDLIMQFISEFPTTTASAAGHSRWFLKEGKTMHDVEFDTEAVFAALNVSTQGDFAIELLPAVTNITAQDSGLINETLLVLKEFVVNNTFPR
jgi:hypothetical protein